jgi:hypothetical protein
MAGFSTFSAFFRIDMRKGFDGRETDGEKTSHHTPRHTSSSASRSWTLTRREQPASSMVTP